MSEVWWVSDVADPARPTLAEIRAGRRVKGMMVSGPDYVTRLTNSDTERGRLFRIICAMTSNGCCPCPEDRCDCFGGIPYEATRDLDLYVKEMP